MIYTPTSSSSPSSFLLSSTEPVDAEAFLALGFFEGFFEDVMQKKSWSRRMGQPIWKQSGDLQKES